MNKFGFVELETGKPFWSHYDFNSKEEAEKFLRKMRLVPGAQAGITLADVWVSPTGKRIKIQEK